MLPAKLGVVLHLLEDGQTLARWTVSSFAGKPLESVLLLYSGMGVVRVGIPSCYHLHADFAQLLEVIAHVCHTIRLDPQRVQILNDGILIFLFLFRRVCVVEAHDEFAIERFMSKVVVEKRSFGMPDMEVSAVFGQSAVMREPLRRNLTKVPEET